MSTILCYIGPDRVGKTTTALKQFERKSSQGESAIYFHGKEPSFDHENLYSQYDDVLKWVGEEEGRTLIMDRSWVCSLIYERMRKNSPVPYRDVFNVESKILRSGIKMVYYLIRASWSSVAQLHVEELEEYSPRLNDRYFTEKLLARRNEHQEYYSVAEDYLNHWSPFPHCTIERSYDFK